MREEERNNRIGRAILGAIREEVGVRVREEIARLHGRHDEAVEEKEMLTTQEAAEYLGVSVSYLHKLSANGALRYTKPGGKLKYFFRKDLDERLRANKNK